MRICTNCGHALEDGEEICSVCSSDLITETGTEAEETAPEADINPLSSDDEPSAQLFSSTHAVELRLDLPDAAETAATPDSTDKEESGPASSDIDGETAPEAAAPLFSFTTATIELDLDQAAPEDMPEQAVQEQEAQEDEKTDPSVETELVPEPVTPEPAAKTDSENYKVVSVRVRNDQRLKSVNKERVAVVIVALLALASVISAVFMIAVPLIRARRQDEAAKEAAYKDYLTGEWLSDTFIYSGEEFPSCEILTIGKDDTFISEIWTSPNDRETYDSETWTVTARQAGNVAVELATSSLRVSYTDSDGNVMVYRRYILKLDSSSLILREYYNEKMTDYYDVVFTRKGNS